MKCGRARERFQEYFEGTLKGGELHAIEEHLQQCEACQREWESLRELDVRLRQEIPEYWESINPAPDFLTRLRQLELEPTPSAPSRISETLTALFARHRMALATGLSICLVIVLALTVPGLLSHRDETPVVSELLPGGGVQNAKAPNEEASVADTLGQGSSAPEKSDAFPSQSPMPETTATIPSTGIMLEAEEEQSRLAIEIALKDEGVKEILENRNYHIVEVYPPTRMNLPVGEGDSLTCTGLVVKIELGPAETPEATLYVCMNTDNTAVTKTMLVQTE